MNETSIASSQEPRSAGRFHPLVRVALFAGLLVAIALPLVFLHAMLRKRLGFERRSLPADVLELGLQLGLILAVLAVSRFALKRFSAVPFGALGLARTGAWKREALVGLSLGTGFPLLIAALGALFGLATFQVDWSGRPSPFLHFAVAVVSMICVAVLEETLFRGYAFQELQRWRGRWLPLIATFVVFGGLHLSNPGGSLQGCVSAGLVGAALYATYLSTTRLWMAIGFHFAWNTVLSIVLGFANGGEHLSGALLRSELRGPTFFSGGAFGPEAGIVAMTAAATLALVASRMVDKTPPAPGRG